MQLVESIMRSAGELGENEKNPYEEQDGCDVAGSSYEELVSVVSRRLASPNESSSALGQEHLQAETRGRWYPSILQSVTSQQGCLNVSKLYIEKQVEYWYARTIPSIIYKGDRSD